MAHDAPRAHDNSRAGGNPAIPHDRGHSAFGVLLLRFLGATAGLPSSAA